MGQLLALDFDGVINSYKSGWIKEDPTYLPDDAVPGAFAFVNQAIQHFDVVIHSSRLRYPNAERRMRDYLLREAQKQGFTFEEAENIESHIAFSVEKPPAHVTLDDRAIQFTGVFPDLEEIIAFRPWNKRDNLIERPPEKITPLAPDELFEILYANVGDTYTTEFDGDGLGKAAAQINERLGIKV